MAKQKWPTMQPMSRAVSNTSPQQERRSVGCERRRVFSFPVRWRKTRCVLRGRFLECQNRKKSPPPPQQEQRSQPMQQRRARLGHAGERAWAEASKRISAKRGGAKSAEESAEFAWDGIGDAWRSPIIPYRFIHFHSAKSSALSAASRFDPDSQEPRGNPEASSQFHSILTKQASGNVTLLRFNHTRVPTLGRGKRPNRR